MKTATCFLVLLLVLGVSPCPAQVGSAFPLRFAAEPAGRILLLTTDASERLLETGRAHLLHFRLYEAERTFRRLMRQPDGGPASLYYLAKISFVKAVVTDEIVYLDEFFARADSLERLLGSRPPAAWRTYLLAESHLLRAFASIKMGRPFRTAMAGRTAYRLYRRLLEDDATFVEAYKGMGLLRVFIGSTTGAYRHVLTFFGYSGTAPQGMQELQRAATYSRFDREEAAIYRALVDVTLNGSAEGGVESLEQLYRAYPESALMAYLYGFVLSSNRRAEEAERALRAAVEAGRSAPYFFIDNAEFYLARVLFHQGRFAEAEPYYRHFIRRNRGEALDAPAWYELGLSVEMQGRRAEAEACYARVTLRGGSEAERAAHRGAQKRLAEPLTHNERRLLRAGNAYDAGAYDEALPLLLAVYADPQASTGIRAETAYRLGRLYHATGRLDEAFEAYRAAAATPDDEPGARWTPWSRYYMGEILARRGETHRAIDFLEAALDYQTPYDYDRALHQQAKVAISRLREER